MTLLKLWVTSNKMGVTKKGMSETAVELFMREHNNLCVFGIANVLYNARSSYAKLVCLQC